MKLAVWNVLLLASALLVQGHPLARPLNDTGQVDYRNQVGIGTPAPALKPNGEGVDVHRCSDGVSRKSSNAATGRDIAASGTAFSSNQLAR